MAKDKTKAPKVEAPVVEPAAKKSETAETVVADMNAKKGLTQSEKLQFATELRHRVSELKEEENPPMALIAGYNMMRDVTFIDLAAGEIACGASATGFIFSGNEIAYKALTAAAASLGVSLPEFKSLPTPSKKQLEEVGLVGVGSAKLLTITDKDVSKDAKKQKKAEKKINDEAASGEKPYLKDHTKIETDEQLKEALGFQLVNSDIANPVDRLVTAAQFYRAYLEARAEKSDNTEAELAKIHSFSLADLLQDISTMVPPTFTASGFGKMLCVSAETSNSVVSAFNMFKRACYDRKTKKYRYSDEDIAAFVRVLIVWWASSQIANLSDNIDGWNDSIKTLSKDAKANAKGIESAKSKIEGCQSAITHFQDMIALTTDPSFDLADNFIAIYKDKENADHRYAEKLYKSVMDTYYDGVDIPELEFDTALLNVQQRIGIVLNMFTSPLVKRDEYSENNLIALSTEAEAGEKKEGKAEGEGSKNS